MRELWPPVASYLQSLSWRELLAVLLVMSMVPWAWRWFGRLNELMNESAAEQVRARGMKQGELLAAAQMESGRRMRERIWQMFVEQLPLGVAASIVLLAVRHAPMAWLDGHPLEGLF